MSEDRDTRTAHILSGLAHDLRSPLNGVIGFSRLLLKGIDGPLSELQVTDVEAIQANGHALLEMIENLIELARIEADCLIRTPGLFHLPPLLEKAIFLAKPIAEEKQVKLDYRCTPALPLVYADEVQIERTLHRLASAALRFVGPGSVEWTAQADEKGIVVKMVARGASGLSPETPYILGGFLSAGTSSGQQIDAVALKMIISERAIAANGGVLWVEDQSEDQISIAFSLPASSPL
jgi:signal transduction histidine kinase